MGIARIRPPWAATIELVIRFHRLELSRDPLRRVDNGARHGGVDLEQNENDDGSAFSLRRR